MVLHDFSLAQYLQSIDTTSQAITMETFDLAKEESTKLAKITIPLINFLFANALLHFSLALWSHLIINKIDYTHSDVVATISTDSPFY